MSEVGALAKQVYEKLPGRIQAMRNHLGHPLTYAEKVVFSHLHDPAGQELERGKAFLLLSPDRVAMQALLQFMMSGRPTCGRAHHRALRPPHHGAGRRARGHGARDGHELRGLPVPGGRVAQVR